MFPAATNNSSGRHLNSESMAVSDGKLDETESAERRSAVDFKLKKLHVVDELVHNTSTILQKVIVWFECITFSHVPRIYLLQWPKLQKVQLHPFNSKPDR